MLDFDEELTRETLKIPWLIWIQIIVLLLLVILLYCFSLFPLDLSQESTCNNTNTCTTLPSSSSSSAPVVLKQNTTTFRNHLQPSQRGENQSLKGEIETSTSTRRIVRGEEISERGGTSLKEASNINYHPCHYFRLAFLKCLGLDSTSENSSSSSSEHKKDR
ncbi:hypothetical protein AB3S75_002590 [Citrus x aurantiifolia]